MANIILSCGHEVDDFEHSFQVYVKSYNREGDRAISYMTVCGVCEDDYRKRGQLFDSEEQAFEWLKNEKERNL
jgi:hypothetical protein